MRAAFESLTLPFGTRVGVRPRLVLLVRGRSAHNFSAPPLGQRTPMDPQTGASLAGQALDSVIVMRLDTLVAAVREPDRNWFYSSLAQSAAAIVGLMGGLLAGLMQSEIEKAKRVRVGFREWVCAFRNEAAGRRQECERIIREPDEGRRVQAAALKPMFEAAARVKTLAVLREQTKKLEAVEPANEVVTYAHAQAGVGRREADTNSGRAQLERAGSFKWPALGIWAVLVVLCGLGVVWPLARLDAVLDGSKGRMILGLSTGLLGLLALLGWQVLKLWRTADVNDLERAYNEVG